MLLDALALVLRLDGLALVLRLDGLALVLRLDGLALVLRLDGLVAGVTLGDADWLASFEGDGGEVDLHTVAFALGRLLGMLLGVRPPADEDNGWPAPAAPGAPVLLREVNPTAEPKWTKAWRSGATASATPMANTAKATARAGRSSPSRQSRG